MQGKQNQSPQISQDFLKTGHVCAMTMHLRQILFSGIPESSLSHRMQSVDLPGLVEARVCSQVGLFCLEEGRFTCPCLEVTMQSWA